MKFSLSLLVGCILGVVELSFGQVPVANEAPNPLVLAKTRGNVTENADGLLKGAVGWNGRLTRQNQNRDFFRISACLGRNGCSDCYCGGFSNRECNRICDYFDYRGYRCGRRVCFCYRNDNEFATAGAEGTDEEMGKEESE